MHPTQAGAAAPKHITALHEFFKSGDGNLFAVRQGARTIDALQQASCFLEVAHDSIDQLALESESLQAFGAYYLLTFARAAIDAAENSLFREEHAATLAQPFPAPDLTSTIAFLTAQLADSRRQAEKEEGQGKAFYDGRVSAFELALSELREVAQ